MKGHSLASVGGVTGAIAGYFAMPTHPQVPDAGGSLGLNERAQRALHAAEGAALGAAVGWLFGGKKR